MLIERKSLSKSSGEKEMNRQTLHFKLKFYNDQLNAQVLIYFIYLLTSALHVSGFLLAHIQRDLKMG
jgi:hypothetical protein